MKNKEIVKRILKRDPAAFNMFYEAYQGILYYLAIKHFNNKEDVDDCVQELLMHFAKILYTYNPNNNVAFNTWVTKIAVNKTIDIYRKYNTMKNGYVKNNKAILEATFEEDRFPVIVLDDVEKVLGVLEYQIVLLRAVQELSFVEISKITGLNREKLRRIYNESMNKLKDYYEVTK